MEMFGYVCWLRFPRNAAPITPCFFFKSAVMIKINGEVERTLAKQLRETL